jgi:urease accessory protein
MRLAEPVTTPWKAQLDLQFASVEGKTLLAGKRAEGPLAVQKALYPEGDSVCHAIVVHPPGGIAGGDELLLRARAEIGSSALLTTPGAGKWYRSAGPSASQLLEFDVEGALEWLPRETIVFNGARATLGCEVRLGKSARYIGWEILCLGRTRSGEKFESGSLRLETVVTREGRQLLLERGQINAGGRILHSPAGLGGRTVFGTMLAASPSFDAALLPALRQEMPDCIAATLLPGLLVIRYLGDSTEQAFAAFSGIWHRLRPAVLSRRAIEPRLWRT